MKQQIITQPTKGFNPPVKGREFKSTLQTDTQAGIARQTAYGSTAEEAEANLIAINGRTLKEVTGNEDCFYADADPINVLLSNEREFTPPTSLTGIVSNVIETTTFNELLGVSAIVLMFVTLALLGGGK